MPPRPARGTSVAGVPDGMWPECPMGCCMAGPCPGLYCPFGVTAARTIRQVNGRRIHVLHGRAAGAARGTAIIAICALWCSVTAGCGLVGGTKTGSFDVPEVITVTSLAFRDQGVIPRRYTCFGKGLSPPLHWMRTKRKAATRWRVITLRARARPATRTGSPCMPWAPTCRCQTVRERRPRGPRSRSAPSHVAGSRELLRTRVGEPLKRHMVTDRAPNPVNACTPCVCDVTENFSNRVTAVIAVGQNWRSGGQPWTVQGTSVTGQGPRRWPRVPG